MPNELMAALTAARRARIGSAQSPHSQPAQQSQLPAAPPATMAALCMLLGDGITDDTLLNVARFLGAKELLNLQLTNKRFTTKVIAAPSVGGVPERLSVVEEAARRWVASCSDQERGWVPRRGHESWLGLVHEVEVLQLPLAFARAHADITLSEDGAVATRGDQGEFRAAKSRGAMRSGRHFAQFTVLKGHILFFGAILPRWDVQGVRAGRPQYGGMLHCFYSTRDGGRYPSGYKWKGMQEAKEEGDRIGMLLDLDQGCMTIYKNDVLLGVMQSEGLTGPFCWCVSTFRGTSARIESGPLPDPPPDPPLPSPLLMQ